MRVPFPATIAAITLCLAASTAQSAERAGETTRVQQASFQRETLIPWPLDPGDEIYRDALVYTERYGSLEMRLDDGSNLTLGPNSDVVIDRYVYAPETSTGEAAISLTQGVLRMVSGRIPQENVSLSTGIAQIGIRGTDFTLDRNTEGIVKIWVDDGAVAATPVQSGQEFVFAAPAFAICTVSSCEQSNPEPKPVVFPVKPAGVEDDNDDDRGDGGGGGY